MSWFLELPTRCRQHLNPKSSVDDSSELRKAVSAALIPSFRQASRHEQFLLLVGPASRLQVKAEFTKTSFLDQQLVRRFDV